MRSRRPGQADDARVRRVVGQLGVDLVGDDDQVALAGEGGDVLQVRPAHDGAGRVVREVEHQHLGAWRDLGFQHGAREAKAVLGARLDRHRHAVREEDRRAIGDVARLVVKHLVARVEQRPQRQVQRLADADRDEHLVVRVVFGAEVLADVAGQRAAQVEVAEVAGVMRRAAFEREDGGFAHVPGRVEVRLADAQADHVLHRRDDVEEVADARARDVAHRRVEAVTE